MQGCNLHAAKWSSVDVRPNGRAPECGQIRLADFLTPKTTLAQGCAPLISRTAGPSRCSRQPSLSVTPSLILPWVLLRPRYTAYVQRFVAIRSHPERLHVQTSSNNSAPIFQGSNGANALRNPKALSASACSSILLLSDSFKCASDISCGTSPLAFRILTRYLLHRRDMLNVRIGQQSIALSFMGA